jgi:hypothetical protein
MANRNITLSMPEELIRRAKVESAKRDLSISALVRRTLERELPPEKERSAEALRRFLALSEKHPIRMRKKLWKREDLYE